MLTALLLGVQLQAAPPRVEIVATGPGKFELRREGKPYFIRGVGALAELESAAKAGANSVRTWGVDERTREFLDRAHRLGMTVTVGYWMLKQGDGGHDYRNPAQVERQVAEFVRHVRALKDHPAVLMWAVGNEMELGAPLPEVMRAVERVAAAVKAEDPTRPVTTVLADMWPEKMTAILQETKSLDVLGINSYGGLPSLHQRMEPWAKPYIITEWQFPTTQDSEKTPWGAAFEPTSTEKARIASEVYRTAILDRRARVLGSYLFYWGRSEPMTASWYNTFIRTGEKLEVVDVLTREWTGKWPANRAPRIAEVRAPRAQRGKPGTGFVVTIRATDPEQDRLTLAYEILSDDPNRRFVGDFEKETTRAATGNAAFRNGVASFQVRLPAEKGPWRVLVVIRDGKGSAATAAVPFFVD